MSEHTITSVPLPKYEQFRDLTGRKFFRLKVKGFAGLRGKRKKPQWHCECECGSLTVVQSDNLLSGHTQSCGCYSQEVRVASRTSHGYSRNRKPTPEYKSWLGLVARCNNPNSGGYESWGGRGIKVCERWMKFESFIADMGQMPGKGYSIERIDNNGNYSPDNCKWATRAEQCRNRRSNIIIEYRGERKVLKDWCSILGLKYHTVFARIRYYGWTVERALGVTECRLITTL